MRALYITDKRLNEVMAALAQSGASEHYSHCSIKLDKHCDCHVGMAAAAYETMRKAMQRIMVRAADLQAGQWVIDETALDMRVLKVEKSPGMLPKVEVTVDYGDLIPGIPKTLEFGRDEQVLVIDPNR